MKYSGKSLLYPCVLLMLVAALLPHKLYAQSNFVYTNDEEFQNTVSGFAVGPDGTLTPVPGSPFATGGTDTGGGNFGISVIAVSTVRRLLFAGNAVSDDVSVFKIDSHSGALTPAPGSPFAIPTSHNAEHFSVAPTPDGRFLIAAGHDDSFLPSLTVFSIDSKGGLTPIPGSPFSSMVAPVGIKISPDGKFLAVVGDDIEMFRIGPDGALTSLGVTSGPGFPFGFPAGVDIDCSSSLLYAGAVTSSTTTVDGYHIGSDGTLAALAGSPFQPGVGLDSAVVLLSPDDKTLFVGNALSFSLTALRVAEDGSLSLVPGSPFSVAPDFSVPVGMAISQDGKFLYVVNSPNVAVFEVASNSTLTQVGNFPVIPGSGALSLAAFPPKNCSLPVDIAIKPPAKEPATINPGSSGKILVAILSTSMFDAVAQVDPASLTFGHSGNEASLAICSTTGQDVNNDGLADLVCQFNTQQTGLVPGDSLALLKGKTVTGKSLLGGEAIRTVPQ
jgi:6-phosphogluconolactonase (cycloisomerase 2 family)